MSPITTHVLDTSIGKPAAGVAVELEIRRDEDWVRLASGATNADGRVADLLAHGSLQAGTYRITFRTRAYFEGRGQKTFYPHVKIAFDIDAPEQHYHVPLLISPFGYSTYRGS